MTRGNGKVNAYNDFKGIGFIRREKGKDLFFSIDDFRSEIDIDTISVGMKLTFDIVKAPKGLRAVEIEVC